MGLQQCSHILPVLERVDMLGSRWLKAHMVEGLYHPSRKDNGTISNIYQLVLE